LKLTASLLIILGILGVITVFDRAGAASPVVPSVTDDRQDPINLIWTGYAPAWWVAANFRSWIDTSYCSNPKTVNGAEYNATLEKVDPTGLTCIGPRDHVRIWDMGYNPTFGYWTIGAVHHEHLVCDPGCHHVIDSWENSEAHVRYTFSTDSYTSSISNYSIGNAGFYQNVYNNGNATLIALKPPKEYSVSFSENGLPSGTQWSVILDGSRVSSTSNTIEFTEPNGTYSYSIPSVPGFTSLPTGTLSVSGSAVTETIIFVQGTNPDFILSANPDHLVATPLSAAKSTISIASLNGFAGNVSLGESVTPASDMNCDLSPVRLSISPSGSSELSCVAGSESSHNITVIVAYTGNPENITHSIIIPITVVPQAGDFEISVLSPPPVESGNPAASTISVRAMNGFRGSVTLSAEIPHDLFCTAIKPQAIEASGNATFSCSSISPGTYNVRITGSSGGTVHTQTLTIIVNKLPASDNGLFDKIIFGLPSIIFFGMIIGAVVPVLLWAVLTRKRY